MKIKTKAISFKLIVIVLILANFGLVSVVYLKAVRKRNLASGSPISQNSIFELVSKFNQTTSTQQPVDENISITLVGDLMIGRMVNKNIIENNDPFWPYQNLDKSIFDSDLFIANLESPLTIRCPISQGGMIFCSDSQNAKGLTFFGNAYFNLANNHILNYGFPGLEETKASLSNNGLGYIGTKDDPTIVTIKGKKIGLIGLSGFGGEPYLNDLKTANLAKLIAKSKQQSQFTIVSLHFGNEYQSTPSSDQIKTAHQIIDLGADLLFAHHPHWLQPFEIYKGKYIFYSLGNFVFDQMWSKETTHGLIVRLTLDPQAKINHKFIPIVIKNYGQPEVDTAFQGQPITELKP